MCYASAVSRHPLIAPNGVENPKHLSAKWRDVFASGFPDNFYADIVVPMYENVAHSRNVAPRNLWMLASNTNR